MDNTTPTNDTPGAMTTASNLRMKVDGELRRRRGTARTSLAKSSGAVTAIADFALSPSNPYALTYISGTINGDQGISSQWGDVALSPISGSYVLSASPATYTINVARGLSQYATGALIFANAGTYPTDQKMGTYVGAVSLSPWATTATTSWVAPAAGTWYFRVYPTRDDLVGPGANATAIDMGSFTLTDNLGFIIIQLSPTVSASVTIAGVSASYITNNGTTTPGVLLGAALAAGAATLPLVLTMTPGSSLGGAPPGMLVQCANSWTSPASITPLAVTSGVVCAHVTASSPRTIGIAP